MLDEEENDFFYLVEPIFAFVRGMEVTLVQLMRFGLQSLPGSRFELFVLKNADKQGIEMYLGKITSEPNYIHSSSACGFSDPHLTLHYPYLVFA
ncbi:hypothetical protein ATY36_05845 [Vibrio cidicii]|nr:hypothetical protein ATY36_05845 [Vibrio cidicii]